MPGGTARSCSNAADNSSPRCSPSIHFRRGDFTRAIADYDGAIAANPKVASSYLIRGLAKRALGDPAGAGDIDKARAMDATVAARYQSYGIAVDAAEIESH